MKCKYCKHFQPHFSKDNIGICSKDFGNKSVEELPIKNENDLCLKYEQRKTLVHNLHLCSMCELERGMRTDDQCMKNGMIVITTIDELPDYCYECPCHDGESGYCQADKERRCSDYRPYWCPLKEIHSVMLERKYMGNSPEVEPNA